MLPLITDRLHIRMMRDADAERHARYRNAPGVADYQLWDVPYTADQARDKLAEQAAFDGPTAGQWVTMAIELRHDIGESGRVIGDLVTHLDPTGAIAEIGYTLDPEHQGVGLASEAAAALVNALFHDSSLSVHRIVGELHPDNVASMRVLESCGLTHEVTNKLSFCNKGEWEDNMVYSVTRDDWLSWRDRPRHRPAVVELVEIQPADARAWTRLETHHSQRRFVATVADSFANALFPDADSAGGGLVPWMRGVLADGNRAGFVMVAAPSPTNPDPFLWRLLVDRQHQGRGIGAAIIGHVADHFRTLGHRRLLTSYVPGKGSPAGFYHGLGFVATGDVEHDEIIAALGL